MIQQPTPRLSVGVAMRPLSPRRPITGRLGTRHLATRLFRYRLQRTLSSVIDGEPMKTKPEMLSYCGRHPGLVKTKIIRNF